MDNHYYSRKTDDVIKELDSSIDGLSRGQIHKLVLRYGKNEYLFYFIKKEIINLSYEKKQNHIFEIKKRRKE